jgi:hypothetical protein
MTDSSSESTAVMPPVESPGGVDDTTVAASAYQPQPVAPPAAKMTDATKAMLVVAAVVLGFVVLAGTFATGAFVGAHFSGGRPGVFAGQQDGIGGPGAGMARPEGRDMMQRRGGPMRGRDGLGQGGPQGQRIPQRPDRSQIPSAPGFPGRP